MKYEDIEKHLKNRLEEYQREQENSEQIWQRLNSELGEREKPVVIWWRIGTIALLLVFAVIAIYSGISSSETGRQESIVQHLSSTLAKEDKVDEASSSLEKQGTTSFIPTEAIPTSQDTKVEKQNTSSVSKSLESTFSTREGNTSPASSTIFAPSFGEKEKVSDTIEKKHLTVISKKSEEEETLPLKSFETIGMKKAPFLVSPVFSIPTDKPFTYTPPQNTESRWRLQLTGGVNTLILNKTAVDTTFTEKLREAEKAIAGWSGGINIQRLFSSGWMLGSGLEFNRYWTLFEHETKTATRVKLEGVVLNIRVDAISGDTILVMKGDTSVAGTSERFVRHYNSYDQLSIPLQLGYLWQKGNWQIGLSGGLRVDLMIRAKGKTLDEINKEVVLIDKSIFRKWGLSAHLQPSLTYQVKSGFGFLLQPSLSGSLSNRVSKGYHYKQYPIQLGLSVGLSYEW